MSIAKRPVPFTLKELPRLGVTGPFFIREYQTEGFSFASVAVSTGIGNDMVIAVNSVRDFVKVIMVTVGCPRIVLGTEPDPLTIPPPVFRFPRFGHSDHLIYPVK